MSASSSPLFLSEDELQALTGRKHKSRQIEWLRHNGVAFRVNATGHPVVTRAAVESRAVPVDAKAARGWTPRVMGA
jgi:hypothetical protein